MKLHFNEHKNEMDREKQMTTTKELHAIVEQLELIDIGDAASYLGEEATSIEEISGEHISLALLSPYESAK